MKDQSAPSPPTTPKSKSPKASKKYPPRDDSLVFGWKKKRLELRLELERELEDDIIMREDRREQWRSSSPFSAEVANNVFKLLNKHSGRLSPDTTAAWNHALQNYNAAQTHRTSAWEVRMLSIKRFYERVVVFTEHQPSADPLLDVLIFMLKDWLENGGKMKKALLEHLCAGLARLPEEIVVLGRMGCVMPVLSFICKELRITSHEFKIIMKNTHLDRYHLF